MSRTRSRIHYRVAKKQIEKNEAESKSMYIPKDKHNKFIAIFFALLFIGFVKGIVVGYLICKNEK